MKEILHNYFKKHEQSFKKAGIAILVFFGGAFILITALN